MKEQAGAPPSLEEIKVLVEEGAFEETLAALEAVVEHLERGRLSMEESVAWYEAGLGLRSRCSELLEQAELRIRQLDADYSGSSEIETPWASDHSWERDARVRFTDS